ncbi:MAG TPA: hypothetical protein VLS49_13595 [Usitatibacter sp.]|nr:hypothetical protein [Usitatibacter sp.]
MPRFRVVIEGSGLEVPGGVAGAPSQLVRGFFVARVVNAPSAEEAGRRAMTVIAEDWGDGGMYGELRARPKLRVAEARPATLMEWLRPKRTGYAFHPGTAT